MATSFYPALIAILLQTAYGGSAPDGGWRFGPPAPDAEGRRLFAVPEEALKDLENFADAERFFSCYDEAYPLFEDDKSRAVMLLCIARFIMGGQRVSITITPAQYQEFIEKVQPLMVKKSVYNSGLPGLDLDAYDLTPAGIPIHVLTSVGGLINQFFLQQYEFRRGDVEMCIEPGDTVIEGGMCWGDSALNFANKVGPTGKVIGFEFEPRNLLVIEKNFELNPELAKQIRICKNALWDKSGEERTFSMAGPASSILVGSVKKEDVPFPTVTAKTLTIDDMVERDNVKRVDYIKMDIEGAEEQALKGAEKTIRRFRPKLAISAYHRWEDIAVLTMYLHSLDLGYKFWLDHFKPDGNETMLFAKTDRNTDGTA